MPSRPVGGFDLVLGHLYNDGWFNLHEPKHSSNATCTKCRTPLTIHALHKFVLAFGNVTEKFATVFTCPGCLNEVVHYPQPMKQKATKQNLVKLFSKLPKHVQAQLLSQRSK